MNAPDPQITAEAAALLCQSQALAIADIRPSPTNPRKTFPEDAHAEMVKSVKQHGVMTPILVRPWPAHYIAAGEQPKYELVAGERRYRAARDAGLPFVPGLVRNLSDHETIELQIIENLHRKDLNELEEAEGYQLAMKQFGYTAEGLAEKIDKSKAYIYAKLKLNAACEAARQAFRDGKLDASRLLLIARIPTAKLQQDALEKITTWSNLSTYRAAAEYIQRHYMLRLAEAPFPRADADLVPAAGKCHPCPKRTGTNPDLYPDVKSADICTDPECFAAKKVAFFARSKQEAKAAGRAVIEGDAARKLMPHDHSSIKGYVKLESCCYDAPQKEGGKWQTYRELIGDKALPIVLVESPEGQLIEAVEETAFQAVADEAGIKQRRGSSENDLKEREAKAKQETEFRKRLHAQIRTAFQDDVAEKGANLEAEELALVARQFLARTWHENQKRLAIMWVPTEEKIDAHERIHRLTAMIDTMEPAQLCLFLMDISLIGMIHVGTYDTLTTPEPLIDTGRRLGVSPDTIRREVKAEQKEKANKVKSGKKAIEAPASAPEPEQPAAAEVRPETAIAAEPEIRLFARVRIKDDAKGQSGHLRKCCGQTGTVECITTGQDIPPSYSVKFDDKTKEMVINLSRSELELLPESSAEFEQAPQPTTRKTAGKVEALYVHPQNHELTWSGRGRQPRWVQEYLKKPKASLQDLLAKKRLPHKPKGGNATAASAACDIQTPRCDKTLELNLGS